MFLHNGVFQTIDRQFYGIVYIEGNVPQNVKQNY